MGAGSYLTNTSALDYYDADGQAVVLTALGFFEGFSPAMAMRECFKSGPRSIFFLSFSLFLVRL